MRVYLVQHGIPEPEEVNPQRPLSKEGREEVKSVAEFLRRAGINVSVVMHSGKLRAKETAMIFADRLQVEEVHETDGLKPLDEPSIWAERLKDIQRDTMLVGHLPHLEKLASLLIVGAPDRRIVAFRQGGVVCIEKDGDGWAVRWAVIPEIVKEFSEI